MSNTSGSRIIKTPFYSNKAKEVLNGVIGQLSDGIWENSSRMNKYWRFVKINTSPNGQIYIEIDVATGKPEYDNRWIVNGFNGMTDDEVIKFFADKIKYIMKLDLKDAGINDGWKRNNTEYKTCYLNYHEDISVAEVYCIYDKLLGRKTSFTNDIINAVVGIALNDTETQNEISRREARAALKQEYLNKLADLDNQRNMQLKEINAKFDILRKEVVDKYDIEFKNFDSKFGVIS